MTSLTKDVVSLSGSLHPGYSRDLILAAADGSTWTIETRLKVGNLSLIPTVTVVDGRQVAVWHLTAEQVDALTIGRIFVRVEVVVGDVLIGSGWLKSRTGPDSDSPQVLASQVVYLPAVTVGSGSSAFPIQSITLITDTELDPTGWPTDQVVTLIVTQDATGGWLLTYPAGFVGWNGGDPPSVRIGPDAVTILIAYPVGGVWWVRDVTSWA